MSAAKEDIKHYLALLDRGVERRGTKSAKWDGDNTHNIIFAMGCADTDFEVPPAVKEAMLKRVEHGAFGYTMVGDDDLDAVVYWMSRRRGMEIKREWVTFSPGVIDSLNVAVGAFTKPGDTIAIFTPVYGPFFGVVEGNGRKLYECPLKNDGNGWTMDLNKLEDGFRSGAKMLLLCSPHNPIGRVWREEELRELHELCERYGVIVASDEIHADTIMPGYKHTPWIKIDPNGMTMMSATKAFNIAALRCSSAIIPNDEIRTKFRKEFESRKINGINLFGVLAQSTCYTEGYDWLDAFCLYIDGNRQLAEEYIGAHRPEFKLSRIEGTYLLWIDMHALNLEQKELCEWCYARGLGLVSGTGFGEMAGTGYMRMNLATPRRNVQKALELFCAK